jgi:hypothetical protein
LSDDVVAAVLFDWVSKAEDFHPLDLLGTGQLSIGQHVKNDVPVVIPNKMGDFWHFHSRTPFDFENGWVLPAASQMPTPTGTTPI